MELTHPKVLALVLAGGEGARLDVLTAERAKPALPYAGVYRLIDFALSNCRHSGVSDVWVLQQYQPQSLTSHLANGRPWDLDRTHGGLRVLHPHLGRSESGWYGGNADALYRNKADLTEFAADLLLVLSADHVYKLDYREVIRRHVEREADVTLVTTRVPREEAGRFGVVQVDAGDRVSDYAYKPDEPASDLVATEVFVFSADAVLNALEELVDGDDESGLEDLGDELLPRLAREGRAYEYRLEDYWRDVGTIESYWQGHMDLVDGATPFDLDDPQWPILTSTTQRPPARIAASARIHDALVSPGCDVRGRLVRSGLAPGVVVEEEAEVRDSVVLEDVVVRAGSRVECALVD
ncbi:MAG: sugar phosphate nucleotidyltransferase, partial [Actinomycetota bacterium]|nr:sugar phosphate nucleotidyltransferase [Actinomycetota bacterium]